MFEKLIYQIDKDELARFTLKFKLAFASAQ